MDAFKWYLVYFDMYIDLGEGADSTNLSVCYGTTLTDAILANNYPWIGLIVVNYKVGRKVLLSDAVPNQAMNHNVIQNK